MEFVDREFAPLACEACRKQKRKCDKRLPCCSLCLRTGRVCDYKEETSRQPSSEDFATLRNEVAELKRLLSGGPISKTTEMWTENVQNDHHDTVRSDILTISSISPDSYPDSTSSTASSQTSLSALFFLDSTAFQYAQTQFSTPYIQVPPGPLSALGNSIDLRIMIEDFFEHVHAYFPVISKIRLYQHLSNPRHEPGADMALLFLAMKLCSSDVGTTSTPQTQLYHDVKNLLAFVEARNAYSIQMLQAVLLICIYELGHTIYPAAYMSAGHAARMGYAMGIHDPHAPQMIPRCSTWTEQEERRRVWWAVLLLDRYVNIGHRSKPFAALDPSIDAHLPIDDTAWDRGQMLVAAPLALSASQTIDVAPFTRTCQAAHFMGKVIRHVNDKNLPPDYRFDEALQLDRLGRSLVQAIPIPDDSSPSDMDVSDIDLRYSNSEALCYSALLTLYDSYSCTQTKFDNAPESRLQVQQVSIAGLSDFSAAVLRLSRRLRAHIDRNGGSTHGISPFTLDCLYQGAANYAWYVRESSDQGCRGRLVEIKDLLRVLDRRWKVAGEYLRIVEASEVSFATGVM